MRGGLEARTTLDTEFSSLTPKVGTHQGTSPCEEEFTRGDWSQGHVPRTVHTKHFEEHVAGTCPKNSNQFEFVGLVLATKV